MRNNFLRKNGNLRKLKIPVNVSKMFDYEELFKYVRSKGFIPEPYLSSSKYSIRAGQDNNENFLKYMEKFLEYKKRTILPGFVHLVYNTRSEGKEVVDNIKKTVDVLLLMGYKLEGLNLILSHPRLIDRFSKNGINVTVSSASILAYKKIIDTLIECPLDVDENISYVLPSTYQFCIPKLPVNSFELLINNGCKLGCVNATVATDHTAFCPIKKDSLSELYYDEFQKKTDVIYRWRFKALLNMGWRSFKVSGRQAPLSTIFDVVKYYLEEENAPPYIDNPIFYGGESSNG